MASAWSDVVDQLEGAKTVETLLTIATNLQQAPEEPKYRRLNTKNPKIEEHLWRHERARYVSEWKCLSGMHGPFSLTCLFGYVHTSAMMLCDIQGAPSDLRMGGRRRVPCSTSWHHHGCPRGTPSSTSQVRSLPPCPPHPPPLSCPQRIFLFPNCNQTTLKPPQHAPL